MSTVTPVDHAHYVTLQLSDMQVALNVRQVRDGMHYRAPTTIPLAPNAVAGMLNVNGKLATVIDLRARLNLPPHSNPASTMLLIVEYEEELFALMVDSVGGVIALPRNASPVPPTIDSVWRAVATGVHHYENDFLILLDLGKLIDHLAKGHAA